VATALPETDEIYFDKISVHGLDIEPTNAQLDGETISFEYDPEIKMMLLNNLAISISSSVTSITWS